MNEPTVTAASSASVPPVGRPADADVLPTPEQLALRKLEHAEQDMHLYAAILGHRPAVVAEADEPPALTVALPAIGHKRRSPKRRRVHVLKIPLPQVPQEGQLAVWVRKVSAVA